MLCFPGTGIISTIRNSYDVMWTSINVRYDGMLVNNII